MFVFCEMSFVLFLVRCSFSIFYVPCSVKCVVHCIVQCEVQCNVKCCVKFNVKCYVQLYVKCNVQCYVSITVKFTVLYCPFFIYTVTVLLFHVYLCFHVPSFVMSHCKVSLSLNFISKTQIKYNEHT